MSNRKRYFLLLFISLFTVKVFAQQNETAIRTINIKGTGLQYDLVRFSVKPGETVRIVLANNDDMSHNLLITQPGAREEIVNAAMKLGEAGKKANFVPAGDKVLWFIPLISPGESQSVTFTAPSSSGVYPYVCTYPGHGFIMYGAMYVGLEMPPLKDDLNIPESRRNDVSASVPAGETIDAAHSMYPEMKDHPYLLVPPYVMRAFLPDTGPDAIGVSLPQQLSYCWDGTTCRLRYAWQGGFLDFTDFWKSYKRYSVKITGNVFYRDKSPFPLRIDQPDNIPQVRFRGYRLVARYPEFHYTMDGLDVYELILAKTDGTGLVRTFRIPGATKPIWFAFDPDDGVEYTCEKGQWTGGKLKLSAAEAQKFSITMTKKEGIKL